MAISVSAGAMNGTGMSPIDMADNGVEVKSITFSYNQAARADIAICAPEQTAPLGRLSMVEISDDAGLIFKGHAMQVSPGSHSNETITTCFDPSYLAGKRVFVRSLPYLTGGDPDPDSVPRLVYNCVNGADEDYAYSVAQNTTVEGLITGLLNYCDEALIQIGASPGGGGYDGDLSEMTFIAQQKIVWESATLRAALEQVWRLEPRFRMFWNPDTSKWTFYKLSAGDAVTLNLNDSGDVSHGGSAYPVIGCEINPSFEDCYTAVKIYGPPTIGSATFASSIDPATGTVTGGLTPIGSPTILESYTDSMGSHNAEFWSTWQIGSTYASQRKGARMLADWENIPVGTYQSLPCRYPTVLLTWDAGDNWTAASGVQFDFLTGTLQFIGGLFPYTTLQNDLGQSVTTGTTQTKFPPNGIALVWAPYDTPLSVRYPSSGFSGTAYDQYGIESELPIYDEALAIGREYGVPVTSTYRLAQYANLAQAYQEYRRDVIFTGTVVLSGIDYSWCRLNKRVNIADAEGSTTGWEAMNAIVTDVEYQYGDSPTTTLTLNGNWMELYGEDPAAMRERLRITSLAKYTYEQLNGMPGIVNHFHTETGLFGNQYQVLDSTTIYNPNVYVDQYGTRELANVRGGSR